MIPCIVAALFGSSRQMVTGPANAISLTVLALVGPLAVAGSDEYVSLVITLAFMVGCWQLLIGFSGLGRLVSKIPHAVIVGFTTGAAILIVNSQIRYFFGFDWERGMSVIESAVGLVHDISTLAWPPTVVGLFTVVACIVAKRFLGAMIPYMLVGVVAGSLLAFGLKTVLGEAWALPTMTQLPGALPPLSMPDLSPGTLLSLLVPSLIMTLLALAEAMSIATAVALRRNKAISGTQEIFAQGLANVAGSFFSSYPTSGSFNRSGVNVEAGARTPLAAISAGLLLIVLLAFVSPLFSHLPMAAIAGLLFVVAWTLMDFAYLRRAMRARRWADTAGWLVTFLLTITISLEVAIVAGLICWFIVNRLVGKPKVPDEH
jgi:SulP family sulfate permease